GWRQEAGDGLVTLREALEEGLDRQGLAPFCVVEWEWVGVGLSGPGWNPGCLPRNVPLCAAPCPWCSHASVWAPWTAHVTSGSCALLLVLLPASSTWSLRDTLTLRKDLEEGASTWTAQMVMKSPDLPSLDFVLGREINTCLFLNVGLGLLVWATSPPQSASHGSCF
ncbi:unnamed protein product, partial [Gulo gulo]